MDTTTKQPTTFTLWVSAYGGWNWDKTTGSQVRVTFEGPNADTMAAVYIRDHGYLAISGDDGNAWDNFPLATAQLYPSCVHGMSLWLCAGPDHYPNDFN
jgi:hypothetical protein